MESAVASRESPTAATSGGKGYGFIFWAQNWSDVGEEPKKAQRVVERPTTRGYLE
jgi:hypothetical protein